MITIGLLVIRNVSILYLIGRRSVWPEISGDSEGDKVIGDFAEEFAPRVGIAVEDEQMT